MTTAFMSLHCGSSCRIAPENKSFELKTRLCFFGHSSSITHKERRLKTGSWILEYIVSGSGNDFLKGNALANILTAGGGDDTIDGGDGIDTITGGAGRDQLTGGTGPDTFNFDKASESKRGASHDIIFDFNSAEGDRIDLSDIDAKKGSGNQAFKFIGAAKFHHKLGELQAKYDVSTGVASVSADTNGDGKADIQIEVHSASALQATDFIL